MIPVYYICMVQVTKVQGVTDIAEMLRMRDPWSRSISIEIRTSNSQGPRYMSDTELLWIPRDTSVSLLSFSNLVELLTSVDFRCDHINHSIGTYSVSQPSRRGSKTISSPKKSIAYFIFVTLHSKVVSEHLACQPTTYPKGRPLKASIPFNPS